MLNDGEKGVVLQRDKTTYAIAPHLPCGLVTSEMLRKIAEIADKYHAALKCTSAQRIAIIGIQEQDVDAVWAEFGETKPQHGHMTGSCVRSIKACPGTQFCKRARQDSLALGLEIDRLYHGKELPGKLKFGVAGCGNQCAESSIKDIGIIGGREGWQVVVGGMCGASPRLADPLSHREFSTEEVLVLIEKIIAYYAANALPHERLGELIDRKRLKVLRAAVGAE